MKIFIASDIHGSEFWCKKMLAAYQKENADKLLLLGDILYHGPRNNLPKGHNPKGVIALLNPLKNEILCVRGNCDCEVDQMVLEFPVLAEYAWVYADGVQMLATHGHIHSPENPPAMPKGSVLLNGHTHIPMIRDMGDFTYVNCGSVALPKENSAHSYCIFENGKFTLRELEDE